MLVRAPNDVNLRERVARGRANVESTSELFRGQAEVWVK
jgi:hypothetical protein